MICDSQEGFEFSWQNSLLSWAFSQQDKKIIGIFNESVTFKYESYHNTLKWTLEHWTVNCVPFSCIDSFHIVHNQTK